MSTDLLDDEAQVVDDELRNDGADIVDDELRSEEEQERENAKLVGEVDKILAGETREQKPAGEDTKTPKQQADGDAVEGAKPEELNQALVARAAEAGMSETLAKRLHQAGLLEESLAAHDRRTIESGRTESSEEKPAQDQPSGGDKPPPPLNAEDYDEELVKRDAFMQRRLDDLQSQVAQLSQLAEGVTKQRAGRFQDWFDKEVAGLKNASLFGATLVVPNSPHHDNRQTLCDAYERICEARGVDPYDCHADLLARAYPAMFPNEAFKAGQRQVIERLRDTDGRFIKPTQSSGTPPSNRQRTPEEIEDKLVHDVQAILDRG